MDKLYIVMPAYNEADNIESVIAQWHPVAEQITQEGNFCHLVVANDGSRDNTWEILCSCKERYPLLECIDKTNSGHGPTVIYLYKWAVAQGADYVFQTDSDGQTIPDELLPLWKEREKYDFLIGTRPGRKDGFFRVLVTKSLRLSIRLITGLSVPDANSPFRLMKSGPLSAAAEKVPSDFFLSNVALSVIATKLGYKMGWTPVSFRTRQGGVSMYNVRKIFKFGRQCFADLVKLNRVI